MTKEKTEGLSELLERGQKAAQRLAPATDKLTETIAQIELWGNPEKYPVGVYVLPKHLDEKVARLQLAKLSAQLTQLTDQQARYIGVTTQGPYKPDAYRY